MCYSHLKVSVHTPGALLFILWWCCRWFPSLHWKPKPWSHPKLPSCPLFQPLYSFLHPLPRHAQCPSVLSSPAKIMVLATTQSAFPSLPEGSLNTNYISPQDSFLAPLCLQNKAQTHRHGPKAFLFFLLGSNVNQYNVFALWKFVCTWKVHRIFKCQK